MALLEKSANLALFFAPDASSFVAWAIIDADRDQTEMYTALLNRFRFVFLLRMCFGRPRKPRRVRLLSADPGIRRRAHGTIEVARDYCVHVTTASGTHSKRYPPVPYKWVDPDYHVVHSSIVSCNANLLSALRGEGSAETTAEDNYKTLELVFAAYESSRQERVIQIEPTKVENWTNPEQAVMLSSLTRT